MCVCVCVRVCVCVCVPPLPCGLPFGWGRAMGVNPDRKSYSRIRQKGQCNRILLAICCSVVCVFFENSCLTSVCAGLVEADGESYWGSAQTTATYLCAWHLAPTPLTNMTDTRKQRPSIPSGSGTTAEGSGQTGEGAEVAKISGFGQATANGNGPLSHWPLLLGTCELS